MTPALNLQPTEDAYIRADTTITKLKLNRRTLLKERQTAAKALRLALTNYRENPGATSEANLLFVLGQRSQAVMRQVLAHPTGDDVPLVQYCLAHANRVQQHLAALGWI